MDDVRAVYLAYLDCLNERRWDELGQYVADGVSYNGTQVGLSGYRAMLVADTEATPDLRFVPDLLLADARTVSCRLWFECTPQREFLGLPPTGARISFAEHVFYRFAHGRIVEVWSLIDKQAVRDQLTRRTDRASRVIAATPEEVFAAFVDPAALVEWLPPQGMRGEFDHFDARPGGTYRLRLTYLEPPGGGGKSDAESDVVEARFIDIVPGERVVQAVDFESEDARFAGTMTMTWSVVADGADTRVDFRADDVPPGISADDHADGMNSSLANLAGYVEGRR